MNFNPLIEIKLKLVKGTTSYLLLKEEKNVTGWNSRIGLTLYFDLVKMFFFEYINFESF